MRAYGQALETVPLALAENSGLNPIETLSDIRAQQVNSNNPHLGIDCLQQGSPSKFKILNNISLMVQSFAFYISVIPPI